jgi:tungstate transport system substrate-binding protein
MGGRKFGIWVTSIALATIVSISGTSYYFGVGPFSSGRTKLVIATTTSLYDTRLLDVIEDEFETEHDINVCFRSAGTGIAIQYAQRGDADMILVHAPSKELAFLEDGYGVCRKIIAYNFFTIVGPEEDPAEISGLAPTQALIRIVEAGRNSEASWVSRGDDSGTHTKEKNLWTATGFNWTELRDEASWYLESGAGMASTLQIADEFSAYTLADMGTYLKYYTDQLISLVVVVGEGQELLNVYSAIAVNKTYNPEAEFDAAITFIKFLVSEKGQQIIDEFGEGVYPQKLFYPAVPLLKENTNPTLVQWIKEFAYFDGEECPEQYQADHTELYR